MRIQDFLASAVLAKHMRRLFFLIGTERQDVLAAACVGAKSDEGDLSNEACAAFRKAGQKGGKQMGKSGNGPKWSNKVTGDGRTLNVSNRRTGERNRCVARGSDNHLVPKCARRKPLKPNSPVPSPRYP